MRRPALKWDIRREGRHWTHEEMDIRMWFAPEKVEYVGGIFDGDDRRMIVMGLLLENLGIDRALEFGDLELWKATIADREKKGNAPRRKMEY